MMKPFLVSASAALVVVLVFGFGLARAQCAGGSCKRIRIYQADAWRISSDVYTPARSCADCSPAGPDRVGAYCRCVVCDGYYVCPCEQMGRDCGCRGENCPNCSAEARNEVLGSTRNACEGRRWVRGRLFFRRAR